MAEAMTDRYFVPVSSLLNRAANELNFMRIIRAMEAEDPGGVFADSDGHLRLVQAETIISALEWEAMGRGWIPGDFRDLRRECGKDLIKRYDRLCKHLLAKEST